MHRRVAREQGAAQAVSVWASGWGAHAIKREPRPIIDGVCTCCRDDYNVENDEHIGPHCTMCVECALPCWPEWANETFSFGVFTWAN